MAGKFDAIVAKRVAGIPVVYIAMAVASVGLVFALRSKPADVPADMPTSIESQNPGSDTDLDTARNFRANAQGDASLYDPNTSVMVPVPQGNPNGNVADRTNDDWLRDAVSARVKMGDNGGPVQAALQAYLLSKELTPDQAAYRDWAIKEFGLPPDIPTAEPDTSAPANNEAWIAKAIASQVKAGASAIPVNVALRAYLAGQPLSTAQIAIRDKAVAEFGLPPIAPSNANPVIPDAARPQGVLPRGHKVMSTNDDTLPELARLYYGADNADTLGLLRNANLGRLSGDGPYAVGTVVQIPRYTRPRFYTSTAKTNTLSEIARKNAISTTRVTVLNPGMKFPVKKGTRVRVG